MIRGRICSGNVSVDARYHRVVKKAVPPRLAVSAAIDHAVTQGPSATSTTLAGIVVLSLFLTTVEQVAESDTSAIGSIRRLFFLMPTPSKNL